MHKAESSAGSSHDLHKCPGSCEPLPPRNTCPDIRLKDSRPSASCFRVLCFPFRAKIVFIVIRLTSIPPEFRRFFVSRLESWWPSRLLRLILTDTQIFFSLILTKFNKKSEIILFYEYFILSNFLEVFFFFLQIFLRLSNSQSSLYASIFCKRRISIDYVVN